MRPSDGKIRLAYILAASHSGSTLLAMLLNGHPEICSVGELKITALGDLRRYRCSCRSPILECPFWRAIARDMGAQGMDFDFRRPGTDFGTGASAYVRKLLQPLVRDAVFELMRETLLQLSPFWRKHRPMILRRNAALMGAVLSRTQKRVIVDSSKIGIRLKFLIGDPDIDLKVLHLVRDGRAVSLTYMDPGSFADARNPARRGGGSGGERVAERLSMPAAAREWRRSNEEAAALLERLDKSRWMPVAYEGLCRRPEATLKEVSRFLGVDPGGAHTDFRSVDHHIIGNGMRLDSSREIALDERWKTALTAGQLDLFEKTAGSLNRRLGYR